MMPASTVSSGENLRCAIATLRLLFGADVQTKDLAEKPGPETAIATGGEERIIRLLEPVVRVGVAAEMRIA